MTENKFQKLSQPSSETTSTTGESPATPKTLLIFDFDDTLFCTKYFDSFSLPYLDIFTFKISLEEINPCLFKEIKELEKSIIELFVKHQTNNYDIVIVSNADLKWINNCLTHFLPELNDYLTENEIKIHSAKNTFSKIVKAPADWKLKCFKQVIEEMYGEDVFFDLNVISLGDGKEEKKAVFNLAKNFKFRKLRAKFIRMISFPSAASIILQLKYLNDNLNEMIMNEDSTYKMSIKLKNNNVEIECVSKKDKKSKENGEKNYLNQLDNIKLNNDLDFDKEKKLNEEIIKDEIFYNDIPENNCLLEKNLLGQKTFFN